MASAPEQLAPNLTPLLKAQVAQRGLKLETAYRILSSIYQDSPAEQKQLAIELLQEEALANQR